MSFNWANVSSALSGVTSTLTSLGITGASATSIINSIGDRAGRTFRRGGARNDTYQSRAGNQHRADGS